MAQSKGLTNQEENMFWLQILGDKASIIAYRLAPEQAEEKAQSRRFSARFYDLALKARQDLTEEQFKQLNRDALQITQEFKPFVFEIMRRQLFEKFYIGLLPPETNGIINMTNMYSYILNEFIQKKRPSFLSTYLLGFWLPVIIPQAMDVENNMGIYFNEFKEKAHAYFNAFLNDDVQVRQGIAIMQNGMPDYPVNIQINSNIYDRLSSFATFIVDMMVLVEQKKLPTSLSGVYFDHFYRIVCYVTTELSFILGKERPVCDLGSSLLNQYIIT